MLHSNLTEQPAPKPLTKKVMIVFLGKLWLILMVGLVACHGFVTLLAGKLDWESTSQRFVTLGHNLPWMLALDALWITIVLLVCTGIAWFDARRREQQN